VSVSGGLRLFAVIALVTMVSACASRPYTPTEVSSASFLQRSLQQSSGPMEVEVAVPSAAESKALTGLDLYQQGIQPIWVKVTNNSGFMARVAHWSIDRHYFPPIEVAYMNRKPYSKAAYASMERWFYENGLPRRIPPGETRSGLIYTNLSPGTKGFTFDIFSAEKAHNFTFFVPMPGFTPDYIDVDFDSLYAAEELVGTDVAGLQALLQSPAAPTHPANAQGDGLGTPLNIAIVAGVVNCGFHPPCTIVQGGWKPQLTTPRQNFRGSNSYGTAVPMAFFISPGLTVTNVLYCRFG